MKIKNKILDEVAPYAAIIGLVFFMFATNKPQAADNDDAKAKPDTVRIVGVRYNTNANHADALVINKHDSLQTLRINVQSGGHKFDTESGFLTRGDSVVIRTDKSTNQTTVIKNLTQSQIIQQFITKHR